MIEQIDLSDSLQEESVTGAQSRRVHVVHIVISTGLPVPCLIIDNLLAGTVLLENHLQQLIQQKYKKNISGGFNHFYLSLHTHAWLKASLTYQPNVRIF